MLKLATEYERFLELVIYQALEDLQREYKSEPLGNKVMARFLMQAVRSKFIVTTKERCKKEQEQALKEIGYVSNKK
jgi:hypothetical protein